MIFLEDAAMTSGTYYHSLNVNMLKSKCINSYTFVHEIECVLGSLFDLFCQRSISNSKRREQEKTLWFGKRIFCQMLEA